MAVDSRESARPASGATTAGGRSRAVSWAPVLVSLGLSLLVLGPALGPGTVLAYDLAWSPDARLTPFSLGTDTPAPRAVPSDAAGVLLGWVVGGAVAQKLVLLGLLVLAGLGAAALLRHWRPAAGALAGSVAVVAAIWNSFVAERLVLGQWTVLLGYAALPWAVRAALRLRRGHAGPHTQTQTQGDVDAVRGTGRRSPVLTLCGCGVLAGVGGANALLLVAPVVVVLLVLPAPRWRALAAWVLTCGGVGAAWWLPSLATASRGDDAGFLAFAARADTPSGLLVALLGGGGVWNSAAVPPERGSVVLGLVSAALGLLGVGAVVSVRRSARVGGGGDRRGGEGTALVVVVVLAVLGVLAAAASATPGLSELWRSLNAVPGGGLVRDAQKLVALWVVVAAAGLGIVADAAVRRGGAAVPAAAALAVALPLVLPSLGWGLHGRISTNVVPTDLRDGARTVSGLPAGRAALLPWRQYRRYGWNDNRVSLSLVPRMVDQQVLYDDSLPLRAGRIAGEDQRSATVSRAIDSGADEWTAVARAGVRYVVQERQVGLATPPPPAGYGTVVIDTAHLLVVDRGAPAGVTTGTVRTDGWWASATGWGVTLLTALAWLAAAARRLLRQLAARWSYLLVPFRP